MNDFIVREGLFVSDDKRYLFTIEKYGDHFIATQTSRTFSYNDNGTIPYKKGDQWTYHKDSGIDAIPAILLNGD